MTFDFCCTQTALLGDSEQAHQFIPGQCLAWQVLARRWRGTILRPTRPQPTIMEHRSILSRGQPLARPSSVLSELSTQRRPSLPEQGFHKHSLQASEPRSTAEGWEVSPREGSKGQALIRSSLLKTVPASPGHLQDAPLKVSWEQAEQNQKTQQVRPDSSRTVGSCVLLTGPCNRPQVTQQEENRHGYAGSPSTKPVVLWWGTSAVQGLLGHLG